MAKSTGMPVEYTSLCTLGHRRHGLTAWRHFLKNHLYSNSDDRGCQHVLIGKNIGA